MACTNPEQALAAAALSSCHMLTFPALAAKASGGKPYNTGLDRTADNHQPLMPLSFLARAAGVFPDHTAIPH